MNKGVQVRFILSKSVTMRFLLLFGLLLLQLVSYLLFCKGFFPTKVLLTPAEVDEYRTREPQGYVEPQPQFDQVVVMVIDALRADFLFSNKSRMSFAHNLLNTGYGIGFTAFSNPPTVTLPRLKGITTGSTPNFIDAVLNIAEDDTSSSLGDQDSWIKQMFINGWKINMFGDDTWHKLFPNYFAKTEGTASFYVSDFTIVDNNVTRHLDFELSDEGKMHWDCLILHYLGLDHIGHRGGPDSSNMPEKQKEMDHIIERIFNEVTLKNPNSLFIVMGDHGMNDVGNHGGSSTAETSAALMFVSQKFKKNKPDTHQNAPIMWNDNYDYFSRIDQIDLVPTLSELIGISVPINNLGAFIPHLLDLYQTEEEKRNILIKNALQLKVLLDKSHKMISSFPKTSIPELLEYIQDAKYELSKTSSAYNYFEIYAGLSGYFALTIIAFVLFGLYFKRRFSVAFLDVVFFVTYSANFIASSFVEEEHHMWWFFTSLFVLYIVMKHLRSSHISWFSVITMMVGLRLLKAWNNSGQKYNMKSNMKLSTYINQMSPKTGPNVYGGLLFLTFLTMNIFVNVHMAEGIYTHIFQVLFTMLSLPIGASKMLSFLTEAYDINNEALNMPGWSNRFISTLSELTQLTDVNKINNFIFLVLQLVWL